MQSYIYFYFLYISWSVVVYNEKGMGHDVEWSPTMSNAMKVTLIQACRRYNIIAMVNSVQFSHSVMSNSLQPHELQHTRPPCRSPTPRVYPNPCPLSQWCHPTISSFVVPFSSCPQSFQAPWSFQMSQLLTSGGQSIGVQLQHQSFQWTPKTDLL